MDKSVKSIEEAIRDIDEGAVIMTGGFGLCGIPENMFRAIAEKGVGDLTIISNNAGGVDKDGGAYGAALLMQKGLVSKFIGSFPGPVSQMDWFLEQYDSGKIKIEIMPQGNLNERIRLAAAGLGGVYTPTGVGTELAEGKETRTIDGKAYILELPLRADFTLIKAQRGDTHGNLVYSKTARNYNPVMAGAADITIAEVEEMVQPGDIDPDHVHTPGIFVQRIVRGDYYEKRV